MFDGDQGGFIIHSRHQKASHRQPGIHDIRNVVLPISIRDSSQAGISDAQDRLDTLGKSAEGPHLSERVTGPLYSFSTLLGGCGRPGTRAKQNERRHCQKKRAWR
jgi:hypothetical protein